MSVINSEHNNTIVYDSRASLVTQSHDLLTMLGSKRFSEMTGAIHNGIVVYLYLSKSEYLIRNSDHYFNKFYLMECHDTFLMKNKYFSS